FIPFDHFWAHDYIGFRAPGWRVPSLFRISVVANHYGFVGGRFMVGGIGRDRMAILTHHDIHVARIEIRDSHIEHAREEQRVRSVEVEHGRGLEGRDGRGFEEHRNVESEHRPGVVSRPSESHSESFRGGENRGGPSKDSKDKESGR
ncbi:MAG TPA: hypothetical protein VFC44_02650, partial [Candidatus Saccharimonadales bacterium]|nr:hypothetical protein [Candidatus Saccharimonadales bacterium]